MVNILHFFERNIHIKQEHVVIISSTKHTGMHYVQRNFNFSYCLLGRN
jgi:hypothetical protein